MDPLTNAPIHIEAAHIASPVMPISDVPLVELDAVEDAAAVEDEDVEEVVFVLLRTTDEVAIAPAPVDVD